MAEARLNTKIGIEYLLESLEQKIHQNGLKISKQELKAFKKILKNKAKRLEHKNDYMLNCLKNDISYSKALEYTDYINSLNMHRDNHEDEDILAAKIEYRCVLIVAGVVLEFTARAIKSPALKRFGDMLMGIGVGFLADQALEEKKKH